jgi:hypothetical protein
MAKDSTRKAPRSCYSKAFLERFDELYGALTTVELDKLLRYEFKEELKTRSKSPRIWESLAYRRHLTKAQRAQREGTPMSEPEQLTMAITPSTPDVEIPNSITFGRCSFPAAVLEATARGLVQGEKLNDAYENAATDLGTVINHDSLPALGNFFRLRFKKNIKEFTSLSDEYITTTIHSELRSELVRQLHQDKWRDAAIIEKTAELFPSLEPLDQDEIKKIGNFWRRGKGSKIRRKHDAAAEQTPTSRSLAKKVDNTYTLSIAGPLLQYQETVDLAKAKSILRVILTEERP